MITGVPGLIGAARLAFGASQPPNSTYGRPIDDFLPLSLRTLMITLYYRYASYRIKKENDTPYKRRTPSPSSSFLVL